MNKRFVILAPLSIGLIVGAGFWFSTGTEQQLSTASHPTAEQPKMAGYSTGAAIESNFDKPEETRWLDAPQVKAYLKRQADKDAMRAYFNSENNNPDTAQAMWEYIETLESSGAVMGFEALHLKMAWLEKNSETQEEFKARAASIVDDFRQRAAASAEQFNPENDPRFQTYKQRERAIIAQVNAMSNFPNGMSQQEYLRQRLLEARIAAYENADTPAEEKDQETTPDPSTEVARQ